MAPGRTLEYSTWRACERFGIRPPDVKESWDEMTGSFETVAKLLVYEEIRAREDAEFKVKLAGGKVQ